MILWRIFQALVLIPLGLLCLFCLISELIRVIRILIAYIRHDDETINKLNLR